ncbi:MAG: LysE family translocator [Pseudomonas sp.]|uniref:LysE family translocator n=1 Tax=Pseudomonas sp. TaxID=306 RepID=UPI0033953F21
MNPDTLLAYTAVAALAILSPGPAMLLALRNGMSFGVRSVVWSSLGNISALFCLSAAAMLGLGLLLKSSALLFGLVKILGALYLFYIGWRHLFGRASVLGHNPEPEAVPRVPSRYRLFREAFLIAAFNPKPILFFTALFPQFIQAQSPLMPQFFALTGIFMGLSFVTLLGYASVAARARRLLRRGSFSTWLNRAVGTVFISFGVGLLTLRRTFG